VKGKEFGQKGKTVSFSVKGAAHVKEERFSRSEKKQRMGGREKISSHRPKQEAWKEKSPTPGIAPSRSSHPAPSKRKEIGTHYLQEELLLFSLERGSSTEERRRNQKKGSPPGGKGAVSATKGWKNPPIRPTKPHSHKT